MFQQKQTVLCETINVIYSTSSLVLKWTILVLHSLLKVAGNFGKTNFVKKLVVGIT